MTIVDDLGWEYKSKMEAARTPDVDVRRFFLTELLHADRDITDEVRRLAVRCLACAHPEVSHTAGGTACHFEGCLCDRFQKWFISERHAARILVIAVQEGRAAELLHVLMLQDGAASLTPEGGLWIVTGEVLAQAIKEPE